MTEPVFFIQWAISFTASGEVGQGTAPDSTDES